MMNYKILISVFLGGFLLGCGGGSSNNNIQEQRITDEKLLSCFDIIPTEDEFNTIEAFECQDIDLSDANFSELNRLPMLKKLVLNNTNLSTVNGLSTLTNLTYLDIENNHKGNGLTDVPPLNLIGISQLTNLQTLNLSKNYINDLSHLAQLVNIETLQLNEINGQNVLAYSIDIGPMDLTPLANLVRLKNLELAGNYIPDTGFHVEGGLPQGTPYPGFMNLETLLNLGDLQSLDVSSSYIKPVDGFNNNIGLLTNLTLLKMSDNLYNNYGDKSSTLQELNYITNLVKLKFLDLHSNIITDVEPLINLMELEYLDLSDNSLDPNAVNFGGAESTYSLGDLSPLVTLTKLRTLILTDSFVSSADIDNIQFSELVNIIL